MKRLRGVGIVCLALGVVILLSAIFATALGARVGVLGAWMDEARAAQAEVSALNAQSDSAQSAVRKAGTAQSRAQSAMETAQETIAAVDEGIAALESGAMDDQALSALNAALQEAQVSLASSEEAVELLGSILSSLMGEGGALQNALDGVADATGEMGASLSQISQAVQSMLLRSLAEPLEELREDVDSAIEAEAEARAAIDEAAANLGLEECAEFSAPEASAGYASAEDVRAEALRLQQVAQDLSAQADGLAAQAETLAGEAAARAASAELAGKDAFFVFLADNRIALGFTAAVALILGAVFAFFAGAFLRRWKQSPLFSTLIALILIMLVQAYAMGFSVDSFGEWCGRWVDNTLNVLRANSSVGMIALGMTLVIITGGIDLAVGSTLAGVGTVVMVMIDTSANGVLQRLGISGPAGFALAIVAGLLSGALIGALIGLAVTKGRVPPFIVTLGAMNVVRSVAQYFTKSYSPKVPDEFTALANTQIFGYRILPILYWLALAAILFVVMKRTRFGRYVYAVGSNERTTRLSGINVDRVKFLVYTLMGVVVALAAVTQVSRTRGVDVASAGLGYELDAIAAVVVGGTSMSGGRGHILGTVLGVLIIGVMNNLLILLGADSFLTDAFKGAIVIAAVLLQRKQQQ